MIAPTTSKPLASDIHEAANLAVELGYSVFKLGVGSKIGAAGGNGWKGATRDPEEVASWYADGTPWNYGIATEGLLVVDPDTDADYPVNEWYQQHAERLLESDCPVVRTPRGGSHLYYRQPAGAGLRNTTSEIADKVDTRADGGHVVGPGSVVDGKAYECLPGRELEAVESLPIAPSWLIEQQAKGSKPKAETKATTQAGTIDNGQRNATLASLGGSMRRAGMTPTAIEAGLQAENVARCNPPLPAEEVSRIATSVSRYEPAEVAEVSSEPVKFNRITSQELAGGDYRIEYLIDGTLVAGQPGVIGGGHKTLKTTLAVDMAIALSVGGYFLGRLNVPSARRVLMMSGESGLATLQETATRIAMAAGHSLENLDNLLWSDSIPKFGNIEHLDALEEMLVDDEIEVLFVDPCYLAMPSADAGNLMAQGELLRSIGDRCQKVGVTLVVLHHTKRNLNGKTKFDVPELEDLSWSGFAEYFRQWLLIGRREQYESGSGDHRLWLNLGGSAGHSALWAIDASEGVANDFEPRRWDVTTQHGHEAIEHAKESRNEKKASRDAEKVESQARTDRESVSNAMLKLGLGKPETQSRIAAIARMTSARALPVLLDLIDSGDVMEATVRRSNGQTYEGYQLCEN